MTSVASPSVHCPPVYRAPDSGVLMSVTLDSLDAVYDRRSGMTHLVAEPVPSILAVLARGEANAPTILARLGEDCDVEGGADALRERLAELAALGLVEIVLR